MPVAATLAEDGTGASACPDVTTGKVPVAGDVVYVRYGLPSMEGKQDNDYKAQFPPEPLSGITCLQIALFAVLNHGGWNSGLHGWGV